jgi:hypothetical protein
MAKGGHDTDIKGAEANNTVFNSGGTAGRSMPQRPIPGPENPGLPISMKKALAKKPITGGGKDFPGRIQ